MLNMVSTADGHATLGGRSGPTQRPRRPGAVPRAAPGRRRGHGGGGDRARGALREDHPRRVPPAGAGRSGASARSRSRASSPGASRCRADIPLLADPAARVVILTPPRRACPERRGRDPLHPRRARRAARPARGARRAARALRRAHAAVRGRPAPERAAAAAGLVDELFLSLAPMLAGGDPADPRRGAADPRRDRALAPGRAGAAGRARDASSLFLRYASGATAIETGRRVPAPK